MICDLFFPVEELRKAKSVNPWKEMIKMMPKSEDAYRFPRWCSCTLRVCTEFSYHSTRSN